jgi:RNA polymerase sigma factor for flagellar operon FliA
MHDRQGDHGRPSAVEYPRLVRWIASRIIRTLPTHMDRPDVVQEGWVGLLEAMRKFDPKVGVGFVAFSKHRIRGAMMDYLRGLDWTPKKVQEQRQRVGRIRRDTEQRLGRHADEQEMADAAGMPLPDYQALEVALAGRPFVTFDDGRDTGERGDESSWTTELRDALRDAIGELDSRERTVVHLLYEKDMDMDEAGKLLGVSKSAISKTHARLILKLKWKLRQYAPTTPHTTLLPQHRFKGG